MNLYFFPNATTAPWLNEPQASREENVIETFTAIAHFVPSHGLTDWGDASIFYERCVPVGRGASWLWLADRAHSLRAT